MSGKNDERNVIIPVAVIGLIASILLTFTVVATKEPIAKNQQAAVEKAVYSIFPSAKRSATYDITENGVKKLSDGAPASGEKAVAAYDESGQLIGIALNASARGYADEVKLLYGYEPKKECVIGFKVISSKETAGFGTKIETDKEFLKNFDCLDAKTDSATGKILHKIETVLHGKKKNSWEIDGISGATITSKAVGKMLGESTEKNIGIIQQHIADIEAMK